MTGCDKITAVSGVIIFVALGYISNTFNEAGDFSSVLLLQILSVGAFFLGYHMQNIQSNIPISIKIVSFVMRADIYTYYLSIVLGVFLTIGVNSFSIAQAMVLFPVVIVCGISSILICGIRN